MIDRLAIILINYRDYADRYLADCWRTLGQQTWPHWRGIIVDNESTPESRAAIARLAPGAELIANQQNDGFAKGNNDGLARARQLGFRFALCLNMDTELEPDALGKLVAGAAQVASWGAIQPRIMLHPARDEVNSIGNSLHYLGFGYSAGGHQQWDPTAHPSGAQEVATVSGAAILVDLAALERVGNFLPELWMYHEDLELSWRLRLAGYRLYCLPDAVIYHKYQFAKSIQQYYWMERNRLLFVLTCYRWPTLMLLLPMAVVVELGLVALSCLSGFWREKLRSLGWFAAPAHWRWLMNRRRIVQTLRAVPDRALVPWFAATIQFQPVDRWVVRWVGNPLLAAYWWVAKRLIWW